ncbi:MAG: TfoX/Sxy family protein [Parvularculales bacterium]
MAVSAEYKEMVCELLEGLGAVRIKNMFGGGGVYCEEVMFALIADETLYFKVNETTIPSYEAEGCSPFVFEMANGRSATMSYWSLPDYLYDDPEEAAVWARRALDVAHAAKAAKPARTKKRR